MTRFAMNNLGDLSRVPGVQVSRDRTADTLDVTQLNYSKTILDRDGFIACKPVNMPVIGKPLDLRIGPLPAKES